MQQKRIPGFDLASKTRSYGSLSHTQKKQFVQQYCKLLLDLWSVKHQHAGVIDIRIDSKGNKKFTVDPFPRDSESDALMAALAKTVPFFKVRDFGSRERASDNNATTRWGFLDQQAAH